jgi:hypothetical protein
METTPGDSRRLDVLGASAILLSVRVQRLRTARGDSLGTFCKPEVAGSIPARSIRVGQSGERVRERLTGVVHRASLRVRAL